MSIRTILAAALVAGSIAAPAFASDGQGSNIPTGQVEFFQTNQTQRLVEGRNSDRAVVMANKAQVATSQGFAPVDTVEVARGANN